MFKLPGHWITQIISEKKVINPILTGRFGGSEKLGGGLEEKAIRI